MDRVEEWRIFVNVATARSFADAARSMEISPQAATRAVAALERRLRTRLLHRTTRSVTLTSDGERYLERGRRVVADVDALEAPADAAAPLVGLLTVTAPILFGQLRVVPIVTEMLALYPLVDVRLLLHDRIVSLAEEGIDVGVRIGTLSDSSLRAKLVGNVRPVLCASPAYLERAGRPRDLEALSSHGCIAFTSTTPIADRWSFGRRVITVRPRLVVNTGQAAIDAALEGVGIVRVLSYQIEDHVKVGRLKVVLASSEPDPMPVHLVQLAGVQARVATRFVELASERLGARPD
jgi:DNA-binding transcriptional LysR family regulator